VNNAGLGIDAPLVDGDPAGWRTMWEVNVHALAVATRAALARFDSQTGGHVVHISSMAGHRIPPGGGAFYSATKHAVRVLTEGLRRELRARNSRTRVSAISPGFVDTEFFDHYLGDPEAAREKLSEFPVLRPEDVARAVQYVLEAPDHVSIHDVLLRPTQQAD
jgi:NADP-dependent 3-hydroxy acid dehydrogenase YdfG